MTLTLTLPGTLRITCAPAIGPYLATELVGLGVAVGFGVRVLVGRGVAVALGISEGVRVGLLVGLDVEELAGVGVAVALGDSLAVASPPVTPGGWSVELPAC